VWERGTVNFPPPLAFVRNFAGGNDGRLGKGRLGSRLASPSPKFPIPIHRVGGDLTYTCVTAIPIHHVTNKCHNIDLQFQFGAHTLTISLIDKSMPVTSVPFYDALKRAFAHHPDIPR
jgi:hypothetical protein